MKLPARKPKSARPAAGVRLMPAVMATLAALLGLKTVAMAETLAQTAPPARASEAGHAAPAPATTAIPAPQCAPANFAELAGLSQAEVQVLQALGERRVILDQRAAQAETQDELMIAAERRLNERLAELHQLETTVNALLGNLDEAQEQRLASLVDVYQRMRAKDAATVFDGLEDEVLLSVAGRMRQASLAEVMGRMAPERARRLTTMLADRARPPSAGSDLLTRPSAAPAPATSP